MKGRAAKRYKTEVKVKRAVGIMKERGITEDTPRHSMAARARKFAASHWGCACWMCKNPRKIWRGKNSSSLTLKERNHTDME